MRRTKIVATIGPASELPPVLDALIAAGMDVARLNSSHSGPDELTKRLDAVRSAAQRAGRPVAVMLDLAGPKLRLGEVAPGTFLQPDAEFSLVPGECSGDSTRACLNYAGLADDIAPGDRLLLDDGALELVVTGTGHGVVRTRVVTGGALLSRKGVNAPGVELGVSSITGYDREVLAWALDAGVDLIAQSFVRRAADVEHLRALIGEGAPPVVTKVETSAAARDIDAIVAVSDVVMVARGDLGVETSPEEVPVLQRRIIELCRIAGVPVIVATQMLESMTSAPRPTRAEASDVANAIFDRVDAVMLSAETAVGSYPVESVETMARIAKRAEDSGQTAPAVAVPPGDGGDVTAAVSSAVCRLASDLELDAIVTATQSGATARAVARHRPSAPVVAATPDPAVARRLAVVWGVRPLVVPLADDTDLMLDSVLVAVRDAGLASSGDRVAITAGISSRVPGATDFILVRSVS
ncbi:MAG: pyruvate kinase [Anaerosomatales bacterium]|nr:pyruvate kinase [Anaerosomatales bacterium]MDT8434138.1 pyruvate kinase [Anaerosomatales bacterium]